MIVRTCIKRHPQLQPERCAICRGFVPPSQLKRRQAAASVSPPLCKFLGELTGETVLCKSCAGTVKIKLRTCEVYGSCTEAKKVGDTACCNGCPSKELKKQIVLNMGAGGLGDGINGLIASAAMKLANPQAEIVYRVGARAMPFVALFSGYDRLVPHEWDESETVKPQAKTDLQLNAGYRHEMATKSELPRWLRYCQNAGVNPAGLASLREPERIKKLGSDFVDYVVLAPLSSLSDREWPLPHWHELERLLAAKGYKTVVLHNEHERTEGFVSPKIINEPAERVAGIMLNALCVVGCDSGLSHVAGMLQVPSLVLCGQTSGDKVFGCYPTARWVNGSLPCSGCYWQKPDWDRAKCSPICPSLAGITPGDVSRLLDPIALPQLARHRTLVSEDRLQVIRDCLLVTKDLPGDVAELGVYRGGVSRIIKHFSPGVTLHAYDTFSGIPSDDQAEGGVHKAGDFPCGIDDVRAFLGDDGIAYHPGEFPGTAVDARYRFAHIDGDTYQTTRDAIAYFVPRMVPGGGIMVFDDYGWPRCPGVKLAIEEAGLKVEAPAANQCVARF